MKGKKQTAAAAGQGDAAGVKLARQRVALERGKIGLELDARKLRRLKAEDKADESAVANPQREPSAKRLAERFGIGVNTIAGLMREPEAPRRHGAKGYLVAEWGAYFLKRRRETETDREIRKLKLELAKETLHARAMENAKREGRFMSREEHARTFREFAKLVIDAVVAVRERVAFRTSAPELLQAAEEMEAEIRGMIRKGLEDADGDAGAGGAPAVHDLTPPPPMP